MPDHGRDICVALPDQRCSLILASVRSGDLVDGRFELEKLAGAGGSGSVYRARDRASGERVALELLNADAGQRERFVREASILADLEHAPIRAARDAVSKRAAYLDEPELRHGFLTRVPENIRILALARAWLGE
ncbi:MAG TPA: hypothetical protein VI072_23920 [Polyangiaceae bacterium]